MTIQAPLSFRSLDIHNTPEESIPELLHNIMLTRLSHLRCRTIGANDLLNSNLGRSFSLLSTLID
jgi:hypothetical protein